MEVKDYIIYHSAGNLYWKDLDKRYLGCNKNYSDILDLPSPQSIIGLTDANIPRHQQLMTADEIQRLTDIDDIVLQTGATKVVEEEGLNKDGEKAIYLTVKKPIIDADNNIIGLIGTSIDITLEKEVEKLKRHQEVTNKLVERLKTIGGSLSHEVRTPMAGVRMVLSSVVKTFFQKAKKNISQITLELLAEQENWIDKMIDRIDSGTALINMQLKNLSTGEIDTSHFYMNSMNHCLQDAINTFPFENQQTVDKVHLSIGKDFEFWGDPLLTKHIIWNLLNNALHFIKETDRGEIFITTGQKDQHYFVSIPLCQDSCRISQRYSKRHVPGTGKKGIRTVLH